MAAGKKLKRKTAVRCADAADNAEACRQLSSSKYCSDSSGGSDPVLTSLTQETHLLDSQLFPLLLARHLCSLMSPLATSSHIILRCSKAKTCCVVLCCVVNRIGWVFYWCCLWIMMKILNFLCQYVNFRGCEKKSFFHAFSSAGYAVT